MFVKRTLTPIVNRFSAAVFLEVAVIGVAPVQEAEKEKGEPGKEAG